MALEDSAKETDTAFTRKGQRGYAFENAFGGATSFLRRTYTKDLTGVGVTDLAARDLACPTVRSGRYCLGSQSVLSRPATERSPRRR